ncbi:hypothetical protein Tco_0709795 [Tanacetum coccineum]
MMPPVKTTSLPYKEQMLERLAGNSTIVSLRISGITNSIDPRDQEQTTFTCPYGTFGLPSHAIGLCKATGHDSKGYDGHYHDMIENTMEVFMGYLLVIGIPVENSPLPS